MTRKTTEKGKRNLFKIKVPLWLPILLTFSLVVTLYLDFKSINIGKSSPLISQTAVSSCSESMLQIRLKDYHLTRPLVLTDVPNESNNLKVFKEYFNQYIQQKKSEGIMNSASVYLRKINDGEWISIYGDEGFNPGSLIKVPVMITYLKLSEKNPDILNKVFALGESNIVLPNQTFSKEQIEKGKSYTVKDLIYYMIVKSDNNATFLLNQNLDIGAFQKLFTDLSMPVPSIHDPDFRITSIEYARFIRLLYNATYLTPENSEYALQLLANVDFKEGLLKQIPTGVIVAHKFGEFSKGDQKQLHEAGIIYAADNPYLLIVMTKGNNVHELSLVLSEISKYVFDNINIGNKNI